MFPHNNHANILTCSYQHQYIPEIWFPLYYYMVTIPIMDGNIQCKFVKPELGLMTDISSLYFMPIYINPPGDIVTLLPKYPSADK